MKICAVIPAAGRGTRINSLIPKLLLPIATKETVWTLLRNRLSMVDHIHLIVSPQNKTLIEQAVVLDLQKGFVSLSVQREPLGMGDAIFQGYPVWSKAQSILVIWGDQVYVSSKTIEAAIKRHFDRPKTVVLPLVEVNHPYVEYCFDMNSQIRAIRQSREGDLCSQRGFTDVGTFVLSVNGLKKLWTNYLQTNPKGQVTKEINFLPFLLFLAHSNWNLLYDLRDDPLESRGINTLEDWDYFKSLYQGVDV